MNYRKFQADHLFDGNELLSNDQVLITDQEGKVLEIVSALDAGDDIMKLKGIISPGFVNAHCHLELSHLKDVIPPHTGLIPFLLRCSRKKRLPVGVYSRPH